MTSQEDLDRLDADVLAHLESDWPQIVEWVKRLAERADAPAPGSALDLDDQAVPGMWVSHIARMSLGTGSQNLMSSVRYVRQFGPTVHSMQSMLRTAIWGGAQAVWLLSPTVRDDRLERASRIWFYSQDNYRKWLNTFDEDNPNTTNVNQLRQAKAHTSELLARLGPQRPVDQTAVVREVAGLVMSDPLAGLEAEQMWRTLGAIAHSLPWEIQTRADVKEAPAGAPGLVMRSVRGRVAELGGELGYAFWFLKKGWELLDAASAVAD